LNRKPAGDKISADMNDNSDDGPSMPSRREVIIRLGYNSAGLALVGMLAVAVYLVSGLMLGPDQLASILIYAVWLAFPLLLTLFLLTALMSLPLYRLYGLADRGEEFTSEQARELWIQVHKLPVKGLVLSCAAWAVSAAALFVVASSEDVAPPLILGLGAAACALLGMTTSLCFYFRTRTVIRPVLDYGKCYLPPDFEPEKFSSIKRRLVPGFCFILVAVVVCLGLQAAVWRQAAGMEEALSAAHRTMSSLSEDIRERKALFFGKEKHYCFTVEPFVIDINGDSSGSELSGQEVEFIMGHHRLLGMSRWKTDNPLHSKLTEMLSSFFPLPDYAVFSSEGAIGGKVRLIAVDREPLVGGRHVGAKINWDPELLDQTLQDRSAAGLMVFLALVLVIGILWSYWAARDVSDPALELKKTADNSSVRSRPEVASVSSGDELGLLASSFNRMSQVVREQLDNSRSLVGAIREAMDSLTDITTSIVSVSSDQAAGASEQAVSLQQILATSEELAATFKSIANNAGEVETVSGNTLSACHTGQQHLQKVVDEMERAEKSANDVGAKMLTLQEQADRIEGMIEIIRDVSEKSNLIALNASIEASAAGERGERFSIVAGEMRDLAEQAMQGTKEIGDIFTDLQAASASAIMAAEEGQKQVAAAQNMINKASEIFQNIVHLASETARAAQEISISSSEQTTATDHLAQALGEIKEVAARFAEGAKLLESSASELQSIQKQMKGLVETGRESGG